ncbi:MAG: hypothetical protein KJ999_21345 [Gammaproteobacteria bacterium]|nr:hypothetical protein [Gammaproteobacteria bacterium]
MSNYDDTPNYAREAAYHLRQVASEHGCELKSTTAHELIAGYFGFASRAAMTATERVELPVILPAPGSPETYEVIGPKEGTPTLDDPFLFQTVPDLPSLERAVVKLGSNAKLTEADIPWVADAINTGLVPACVDTREKSLRNLPVYDKENVLVGFASPSAVASGQYDTCRCCDSDRLYPTAQMHANGLCHEHRHEFDLDPEEAADLQSFIEYQLTH